MAEKIFFFKLHKIKMRLIVRKIRQKYVSREGNNNGDVNNVERCGKMDGERQTWLIIAEGVGDDLSLSQF